MRLTALKVEGGATSQGMQQLLEAGKTKKQSCQSLQKEGSCAHTLILSQ